MDNATKIVLRRHLAQALQAGELSIERGIVAMREIDGDPVEQLYMIGCTNNQPTGGESWSSMFSGTSLATASPTP